MHMCVGVCICVHICVGVCMHIVLVCACVCMHVCVDVCMCVYSTCTVGMWRLEGNLWVLTHSFHHAGLVRGSGLAASDFTC